MSDLRTRIAGVICEHQVRESEPVAWICTCGLLFDSTQDGYMSYPQHLADVVIDHLDLRQEWGSLDDEDSGALADDPDDLKPWASETIKSRYITNWTPREQVENWHGKATRSG